MRQTKGITRGPKILFINIFAINSLLFVLIGLLKLCKKITISVKSLRILRYFVLKMTVLNWKGAI